jgi:hypothetical protein
MGITAYDIKLIEKALEVKPDIKTVCELGSQNLYLDNVPKPPFASTWYEARGIEYTCIDMAGDNDAIKADLSQKNVWLYRHEELYQQFDLVTDFGTSEHVVTVPEFQSVAFHDGHINSVYPKEQPTEQQIAEGFYNCWANKHNLLKAGGLMINVNPMTGNWPGHGYTYLTRYFYKKLADLMDYDIILLEEHAAMGNTESGWNVVCILRKTTDKPFISFEDFQQCEQLRR